MTTLLVILAVWVIISVPVALLLGRLFRSRPDGRDDVGRRAGDRFTPVMRRGGR
jgi:hypothetical protein